MAGDDLVGDVKEEAKQRLRSPYGLSYALAWCAVNYEFLIVVFSDGAYVDKIGYLARHLKFGQSAWLTFGLPAVLAFIPILALPMLNQMADVWSKVSEVGASYFKVWLDTGRRVSDEELRALARRRQIENAAIRARAEATFLAYGEVVFTHSKFRNDRNVQWVPLTGASVLGSGVQGDLAAVVESVGFPEIGFEMLRLLQREGARTEAQLFECGRNLVYGDKDKREYVAFLLGAGLLKMTWPDGVVPVFDLTKEASEFVRFVEREHPESFKFKLYG